MDGYRCTNESCPEHEVFKIGRLPAETVRCGVCQEPVAAETSDEASPFHTPDDTAHIAQSGQ